MGGVSNTNQNTNLGPGRWMQVQFGYALVFGFAVAAVVWTTWFVTHLPWVSLSEPMRAGGVIAAWVVAAAVLSRGCTLAISIAGGLISALLGLLILGAKLIEPGQTAAAVPSAVLIGLAFLAMGGAIGLVGAVVGRALPRARPGDALAQFAVAAAATVAPLLFIGGLVTSTNSGMAVPDWPQTYGTNMFLYPLKGAGPAVFLEHSHRLFGTLVGLSTLTLMIWTLSAERRKWVKMLAIIAFSLVVIQGVLGGARVLENKRLLAMLHGVLAQLTFGTIVGLAAALSPMFKAVQRTDPIANPKKLRIFVTAALHSTLLQLLFGAMYRHFRDKHSLFSHMGLAMVVLILALAAGFAARSVVGEHGGLGKIMRRCGTWLLVVVLFQFILGWMTFSMGGKAVAADSPGQALLRTVHQANGAALLAVAVLAFVWAKRLLRVSTASVS